MWWVLLWRYFFLGEINLLLSRLSSDLSLFPGGVAWSEMATPTNPEEQGCSRRHIFAGGDELLLGFRTWIPVGGDLENWTGGWPISKLMDSSPEDEEDILLALEVSLVGVALDEVVTSNLLISSSSSSEEWFPSAGSTKSWSGACRSASICTWGAAKEAAVAFTLMFSLLEEFEGRFSRLRSRALMALTGVLEGRDRMGREGLSEISMAEKKKKWL